MSTPNRHSADQPASRRDFLKTSAALAAAGSGVANAADKVQSGVTLVSTEADRDVEIAMGATSEGLKPAQGALEGLSADLEGLSAEEFLSKFGVPPPWWQKAILFVLDRVGDKVKIVLSFIQIVVLLPTGEPGWGWNSLV